MSKDALSSIQVLFKTVVEGNYCIGCGACTVISGYCIDISLNEYGTYKPSITSKISNLEKRKEKYILEVCPFSEKSINEDELAGELFPSKKEENQIGRYQDLYTGYVIESDFREKGSSGGFGTWILIELLKNKLIDGVIHVRMREKNESQEPFFKYEVSRSLDEIKEGSGSKYYPIEFSKAVKKVYETPGKYVFVGIPCFVKAIRLLCKYDPILQKRIKFCVGLVCGHLKSSKFAESFIWQTGLKPEEIIRYISRHKFPNRNANDYGVKIVGYKNKRKQTLIRPYNSFYGGSWALGFFKYGACEFCDDVFAETADITIGDAWLPRYVKDSAGTNLLIIRNPVIKKLIEKSLKEKKIYLEEITTREAKESQAAGLRHRNQGLKYRLFLADAKGIWRPKKRLEPESEHLSQKEKKKYYSRQIMSEESHKAYKLAEDKSSFKMFVKIMNSYIRKYDRFYLLKIKGLNILNYIKAVLKK